MAMDTARSCKRRRSAYHDADLVAKCFPIVGPKILEILRVLPLAVVWFSSLILCNGGFQKFVIAYQTLFGLSPRKLPLVDGTAVHISAI